MNWQHWLSIGLSAVGAGMATTAVVFPSAQPYVTIALATIAAINTGLGITSPKAGDPPQPATVKP